MQMITQPSTHRKVRFLTESTRMPWCTNKSSVARKMLEILQV